MKHRHRDPSIEDFPDWTITVSAESEMSCDESLMVIREVPIFMIVAKRGGRKLVSTGSTAAIAWTCMVKLLGGVS